MVLSRRAHAAGKTCLILVKSLWWTHSSVAAHPPSDSREKPLNHFTASNPLCCPPICKGEIDWKAQQALDAYSWLLAWIESDKQKTKYLIFTSRLWRTNQSHDGPFSFFFPLPLHFVCVFLNPHSQLFSVLIFIFVFLYLRLGIVFFFSQLSFFFFLPPFLFTHRLNSLSIPNPSSRIWQVKLYVSN